MTSLIEDEWINYLKTNNSGNRFSLNQPAVNSSTPKEVKPNIKDIQLNISSEPIDAEITPICDELYISTKTKVLFLNQPIDIHNIFWKIPIMEYSTPKEGIIKKQIKVVSKTPEELAEYQSKLVNVPYFKEHIIKQIDNQTARRTKFKDERKITIGISKKDITNSHGKIKNAFYNCFAIILRFSYLNGFKEIHVKVFNTGKLEIPGVLNAELFVIIKRMILETIQPNVDTPLYFMETNSENNVLINSNFNCGYYINRDALHSILRSEKYGIESAYDSCSYPGVKCKYYFNNDIGFDAEKQRGQILPEDRTMKMSELGDNNKYTEISFMIFRTGSCLIVGNCTERILKFVFEFIKQILATEYSDIHVTTDEQLVKNKKVKIHKKMINISNTYFTDTIHKNNAK
jgi:hypothetical protein